MIFANRSDGGRSLAWRLEKYADRDDVVVLAIPRGGVPVAFEVAQALHAPLDVFLLRKLGAPGHPEIAFGAIASGGVRVLDRQTLRGLRISPIDVGVVTAREQEELKRREFVYRGDRPPLSVAGKGGRWHRNGSELAGRDSRYPGVAPCPNHHCRPCFSSRGLRSCLISLNNSSLPCRHCKPS